MHTAPTLAGLKVGSIFNAKFEKIEELKEEIGYLNQKFKRKGLVFTIVRVRKNVALIYVYRPAKLQSILQEDRICTFLKQHGYAQFSLKEALETLTEHLKSDDFPHEIGVFLGYPLEDVIGFIENKGANAKKVGLWKVYGEEEQAEALFRLFKRCTTVYKDRCEKGFSLEKLTVPERKGA